jgi:hypothetical protein
MSSITGVAESCNPNCHGVGWPAPASAIPQVASKTPAAAAVNREIVLIVFTAPSTNGGDQTFSTVLQEEVRS